MRRVFEIILNIKAVLVNLIDSVADRFDVDVFGIETLLFFGIFGNHHRQFCTPHIIDYLFEFGAFFVIVFLRDLLIQQFNLLGPVMFDFAVKFYRGVLVNGDDQAFAQIAATGKVVDDMFRDLVETVIAFEDFQLFGIDGFQTADFVVVQIVMLYDFGKIAVQEIIGQPDFGCAVAVKERYGRAVLNALGKVVLRNVIPEPLISQLLGPQQRCSGKGDEIRIR